MKKVLVFDDDESILDVIKIVLEDNSYNVATSSSGKNFLEKIKKYSPNLILLDISMPILEGQEMMKLIKKEKDLLTIPIILVSAINGLEKKAKKLGANGFINKPFDMNLLLEKVRRYIS